MKNSLVCVSLLLLLSAGAIAQGYQFPELEGYKRISDYPEYGPDNLWDFINGAADNYLSYGFENLSVTRYSRGKNDIKVEVYRHSAPVTAFGIYSSERSPDFRFINIGSQGYRTDNSLHFLKGKFYVKIRASSSSEKLIRSMESLAMRIADLLPGEAVLPEELGLFPENGKTRNGEVYINENILGHSFLSGAFRATYESGTTSFMIYIIKAKSPEEAAGIASKYLTAVGLEPDEMAEGKYVFRDRSNGNVFLSWKGARIVVITGLEKDQADIANMYASSILGQ